MDQGLNLQLALALNGLAGRVPLLDKAAAFVATDLIFLVFLAVVFWWFLPMPGDVGKRAALATGVAVVLGQLLNLALGHFIYVPRPYVAHGAYLLVSAPHDSSFPSDHTTAAFAVAVSALIWAMPGRRLLLLGAVCIALARVYVGAHYPVDVLAGAILGAMWAGAIFRLDHWLAYPYKLAISIARRVHLA